MQKIVLFIEPCDDACFTPLKIENLFMNRFAVEEDAASEILKIFELGKTSGKKTLEMSRSDPKMNPEYQVERKQKGMDLNIYK